MSPRHLTRTFRQATGVTVQLRYGQLQPLWTGLRLVTVDPEIARRVGLPVARGALVYRVYPDSPADQAGLAGAL